MIDVAEINAIKPDIAAIEKVPKVLLHDHLDGGLRPATLIDLAQEIAWELPTSDPEELTLWYSEHEHRGDLVGYLRGFGHTVGVMQTREAISRVAQECAEDLAADGVAYAEIRLAPELHRERGLELDDVLGAVVDGFDDGTRGTDLMVRVICTAMRTTSASEEIASLAVRWRDAGVVGFDLAGAEDGFPPSDHHVAFDVVRRANFHTTVHAGESFGLPSIWEAIHLCSAERLGHGVRIVDDITDLNGQDPILGHLASYVRDRRIALEICPSSNVDTGAVDSIGDHPIDLLKRLGFRVTVNTDNRLMSGTSLSKEMALLVDAFGHDLNDLKLLTVNAAKSAFLPFPERLQLIDEIIVPGFDAVAGA